MKKVKQREFQLKFWKMKDEVCEVEGKNGAVGVWMPMEDYLIWQGKVLKASSVEFGEGDEDWSEASDEKGARFIWATKETEDEIEGGSVKVNGMDGEMINVSIPKGARIVFDTPTPPW